MSTICLKITAIMKMILLLSFLYVCVSFSSAASIFSKKNFIEQPVFRSHANPKIVGGEEAVPHSIPFQVALFLGDYFCGGSLISNKYVLTAGHCGVLTSKPQVILGAHYCQLPENTQVILTGSRVIVHERYDAADNLRNDIALIELPVEVELNDNIQTVELASSDIGSLVGEIAQVSGWGITHDSDTQISAALNYVNSTILSNEICQREFGASIAVFSSVICLDGKEGKSSCSGDSGGPLVIKDENGKSTQVGLTSYGVSVGCELGYPSAFTRISSYADWLEANMQ